MEKQVIVFNSSEKNYHELNINLFKKYYSCYYLNFESKTLIEDLLNIFDKENQNHVVLFNDVNSLNNNVHVFLKKNQNKIGDIDFFQISGGSFTFIYFINFLRRVYTILPFKIPLLLCVFFLKFFNLFKFYKISRKIKNLINMKLYVENKKKSNTIDLYLKYQFHWNILRPKLTVYIISRKWLLSLKSIYNNELITLERCNIALARSGNFKSTGKCLLL